MTLTKRQREVLDFIVRFIDANGYSPSLEEIAGGIGCQSIATVHKHLANLEAKGAVRRRANRSRSVEPREGHARSGGNGTGSRTVPLLGEVAAGRPIEAIADDEPLALPTPLGCGPGTFALRVRGCSMVDEQICDGDVILVERVDEAENGQTIVALIDGRDVTVKKWYAQSDGTVRLEPANASEKALVLEGDRVTVHGRVVGLLRKY
jgi:repressor LexA